MNIDKTLEGVRKRWKKRADNEVPIRYNETNEDKGTKTSGNWGHKGRPGEVGGSSEGGGHRWLIENRDTFTTKDGQEHATRWLKTSKKVKVGGPRDTKKFLQDWQKDNEDFDLKSEGSKYNNALSTVKEFDKVAPDKKDGTFSMNPPYKRQDIKRGYSVTFHQNNKADDPFGGYDDETYGQMCAIAKHDLSGLSYGAKGPFVGNFGNPELSFVADDVDDAMEFAVSHNQHSVWDNKSGILMINPFYKPSLNPIEGYEEDK